MKYYDLSFKEKYPTQYVKVIRYYRYLKQAIIKIKNVYKACGKKSESKMCIKPFFIESTESKK